MESKDNEDKDDDDNEEEEEEGEGDEEGESSSDEEEEDGKQEAVPTVEAKQTEAEEHHELSKVCWPRTVARDFLGSVPPYVAITRSLGYIDPVADSAVGGSSGFPTPVGSI